jgi:hypothetical protein
VAFLLLQLAEIKRGTPITTVVFQGESAFPIQLILASQAGSLPLTRPAVQNIAPVRPNPAKPTTPPNEDERDNNRVRLGRRIPRQKRQELSTGDKVAIGLSVSVVVIALAVVLYFVLKKPSPAQK